jgi:hypothetical protein
MRLRHSTIQGTPERFRRKAVFSVILVQIEALQLRPCHRRSSSANIFPAPLLRSWRMRCKTAVRSGRIESGVATSACCVGWTNPFQGSTFTSPESKTPHCQIAVQKGHILVSLLLPIKLRLFEVTLLECAAGMTGLEPAASAVTGIGRHCASHPSGISMKTSARL